MADCARRGEGRRDQEEAASPLSAFEVASVKHSDPKHRPGVERRGGPGTSSPGQFSVENESFASLAMDAYEAGMLRNVEWKMPWMATEHYDVFAKVPAGATKEQFRLMLRRLLEERSDS